MEKIWLESYQTGVPREIDLTQCGTLVDLFTTCCADHHSKIALENFGSQLSYKEFFDLSRAFATYLQQGLRLEKGDRLAIMLPNILQYPIALFGALQLGLVIVNINPWYTPDEIRVQLSDSSAKALIVLSNFTEKVREVLPSTYLKYVITTELGELLNFPRKWAIHFYVNYWKPLGKKAKLNNAVTFHEALQKGKSLHWQTVNITTDDLAFFQYTGGTTGTPKAALLTHGNLAANVEQAFAWIKPAITVGKEMIITALPLYHIFALTANCLTFLRAGAHNILITDPRNIKQFIQTLRQIPFSVITGVNTLFKALLDHPDFEKLNFQHLRISLSGGMPTQEMIATRWQNVTGGVLLEAYGLTEASPAVAINPVNLKTFNNSIGLPIPSTEVAIRDNQGNEVELGEAGELWVRGPQVMQAYWQQPEETQLVLSKDGWLRTGDRARMDEKGFIYIIDRIKDLILVSGFNVYPSEVENVLLTYPGIAEAAVVGIPDENSGERVAAFVVPKNMGITDKILLQHCRQHLAAYKIPKSIRFLDRLPKSMLGKVLRYELRKEV